MSFEPTASRPVHKFGGASLADGACIRRVGALLAERAAERPIAVVSAIEGVTTLLDRLARAAAQGEVDLNPIRVRHRSVLSQLGLDPEMLNRHFAELSTLLEAVRRSGALNGEGRDHVLSFGERASARIVAAHLTSRGLRALPIDAYDLGLVSDSNHGRAQVLPNSAERVRSALASIDGIPVITGFVAQDSSGRLTTLGRNGSDLSASLIGAAIGASEVRFWKEVGGVMTADPKFVADARVLRRLSYDDATELTFHGAGVLHADAVQPLASARIPGRVVCVRDPSDEGTLVCDGARADRPIGVACRRGLAWIRLAGAPNLRALVQAALERTGVEALTIDERSGGLELVAPWSDELARALVLLATHTTIERELAGVAAIGVVDEARIVEGLNVAGIAVRARWHSGARASFVLAVAEVDLARAANCVHALLFEGTFVEGSSR